ncbi:hypothetical protein DL93DRAFT_125580 [Clavulina sp. PMI_390]|nr:hypothetical protein DL93DRAFT_125580 [Clavulina sp. PMI_390]
MFEPQSPNLDDQLPYEVTHLGNITAAGILIPEQNETPPAIAYDGTLVHVGEDRALRIVVFRPDQPPNFIEPSWSEATNIDAAIYSPVHRYLATRAASTIRVYQLAIDRGLWEQETPLLLGEHIDENTIWFWKWLSPTRLVFTTPSDLLKWDISPKGGYPQSAPVLLFPLSLCRFPKVVDVVSSLDQNQFVICIKPDHLPQFINRRCVVCIYIDNGQHILSRIAADIPSIMELGGFLASYALVTNPVQFLEDRRTSSQVLNWCTGISSERLERIAYLLDF